MSGFGQLRLPAKEVEVEYDDGGYSIEELQIMITQLRLDVAGGKIMSVDDMRLVVAWGRKVREVGYKEAKSDTKRTKSGRRVKKKPTANKKLEQKKVALDNLNKYFGGGK